MDNYGYICKGISKPIGGTPYIPPGLANKLLQVYYNSYFKFPNLYGKPYFHNLTGLIG